MLKGIFWIAVGLALAYFVFIPMFLKSGKFLIETDWKAVFDKLKNR